MSDPTPRQQAAAKLKTGLARDWKIIDEPGTVDAQSGKCCVLIQTELSKVAIGSYTSTLDLTVLVTSEKEVELERALYDVIDVLNSQKIGWTVARRAVFQNIYPCYQITLTGRTTITPKE